MLGNTEPTSQSPLPSCPSPDTVAEVDSEDLADTEELHEGSNEHSTSQNSPPRADTVTTDTQPEKNECESVQQGSDTTNNPVIMCCTCNGAFKPQYRPLTCQEDKCTLLVHKQQQCSGQNRHQQMANKPWRCSNHGRQGPLPGSVTVAPEATKEECMVCKAKFRANIKPLKCRHCEGECHANCTELTRKEIQRIRKPGGHWLCSQCLGKAATAPPNQTKKN